MLSMKFSRRKGFNDVVCTCALALFTIIEFHLLVANNTREEVNNKYIDKYYGPYN